MLEEIISNPQLDIEIRPRYEYVDQDGIDNEANALTVRTAIGVKMGLFGVDGLNAQIQGMDVSNFGWVTDYKPEDNSEPYPVVMDPSQSRVTQANISYTYEGFTGIVGRKMVVLDNARFIGNVGWRQMPQTYDLVAGIYNWEGLNLLAAYVTRVNTIAKDGKFDTNTILLHATYTFMPELTVTAYDYMVSNFADHIGIRGTGKFDLGGVALKYEAEYAYQKDPTMDDDDEAFYNPDVTDDNDADYYKIGLEGAMSGFTAGIAYEVLGEADGNPGNYKGLSFNTPLATKHAMNGWADKFLGTPQEGLEDLSFKLAYNFGEYGKIVGIYHIFSSMDDRTIGNENGDDLGDEIDVAYNYKITKDLGLLLKGAFYSGGDAVWKDSGYKDTDKYWVQLDYKFHTGF
jgi:hypothetical protein